VAIKMSGLVLISSIVGYVGKLNSTSEIGDGKTRCLISRISLRIPLILII
jgi:hypothetical protein